MDSIRSQLKDMGFSEAKVDRALSSCPEAQTLEQVMEWLIAHENDLNVDDPGVISKVARVEKESIVDPSSIGDSVSDVQIQEQNKEPVNESAVSMATRKKITVEEAQQLIRERQAQRAEEERKKAIEDERKRRLEGQKLAETRAELQDQERIRLAQQIRREKVEKELHKKQVLEQIARDREAMRLKSTGSQQTSSSGSSSVAEKQATNGNKAQSKVPSTECKLALRFPDGTNLVQKFSAQEQLAAVRLFVQMEKSNAATTGVEFVAPPNKKLTESDMNNTLENLGLCPASRLEVKFSQSTWQDLD